MASSVALLRISLRGARPPFAHSCVRLLAARAGVEGGHVEQAGSSALAEQLRGPQASQALQKGGGGRVKIVSADRDFLLSLPGSQQILLHDHRDTKFLKQVSAMGLAGTLMSSSAVAYAISFKLEPIMVGGFALQTVSAALLFTMYLRTYVARLVLDTRRSQLLVTGCLFFGEVSRKEQVVPLMSLRPGADVADQFVKFRMRGSPMNPATWISYRMPRFQEGVARKPGAQVGFTPVTEPLPSSPTMGKLEVLNKAASAKSAAHSGSSAGASPRRFPGAGLGVADDGFGPSPGASRTQKPKRSGPSVADAGEGAAARFSEQVGADKRKILSGLRLLHGLPTDAREEQKILDFLNEPMEYAAFSVKA